MQKISDKVVVGILLAAGRGKRFDVSGSRNKLTQILPDGSIVVAAAANNLKAGVPIVYAAVRPGAVHVIEHLSAAECVVVECPDADDGMAASLVCALLQARNADGWVIALGDMPYVRPSTIIALGESIRSGADIAVPTYRGQRGNPVGFSRKHFSDLVRLTGDQGARRLLSEFPVVEVATSDPGIQIDVDRPEDLAQLDDQ